MSKFFCIYSLIILTLNNFFFDERYIYFIIFQIVLFIFSLKRINGLFLLLNPGFWFGLTWGLALISYCFLDAYDYVPVKNMDMLSWLFNIVIFSNFLFFVFSVFVRKKEGADFFNNIKNTGSYQFSMIMTLIVFLGGLINWVGVGMPIAYDDQLRQNWLTQIPRVTAITWYLIFLIFPLAFYKGLKFFDEVGRKRIINILSIAVPCILWMLSTGGRQFFGFVILYYIIGLAVGLILQSNKPDFKIIAKKFFVSIFLIVFSFGLMASLTTAARLEQQNSENTKIFETNKILSIYGYFIYYMGGTIMTTQAYGTPTLRDNKAVGIVSFNGVLDIFGPLSLYNVFGVDRVTYKDTNPERDWAASGQELAFGTKNVFYDLYADFGKENTYFVVFLLILFSQCLYTYVVNNNKRVGFISFSIFIFFVIYWIYSQQLSLLIHTQLKWTIYSFALWYFSYKFFQGIVRSQK